ncbi:hypothetical protein N407_05360 [Helicobacter pylori FD662]|nr:hypothetical protein N407_05360 [Helicobacter pylori FD662]
MDLNAYNDTRIKEIKEKRYKNKREKKKRATPP